MGGGGGEGGEAEEEGKKSKKGARAPGMHGGQLRRTTAVLLSGP